MAWEHKSIKIEVDDRGRFTASVKEVPIDEATLDAAKAVIEKELSRQAQAKAVSLKVVGILHDPDAYWNHRKLEPDKIHRAVLTGVNRNTGDLMFTGVPKDRTLHCVMADTPECAAKLEEYMKAQAVWAGISEHIKKFSISGGRSRVQAQDYDDLIAKIELQHSTSEFEHAKK